MIGGTFGTYVLAVSGAVILLTIAEMIMPEGQTAKYVRSALSLVLVLIIISPLSNLLSGTGQLFPDGSAASTQQEQSADGSAYITGLNETKAKQLAANTEKYLNNKGFYGMGVTLDYTGKTSGIAVEFAHVDVKNLVYPEGTKHIDYQDRLIACVSGYLQIESGRIVIHE